MKRAGTRLLVLLILFVVALCGFGYYVYQSTRSDKEVPQKYENVSTTALPVLYQEWDGYKANGLCPNIKPVESTSPSEALMIVGDDGILTVTIMDDTPSSIQCTLSCSSEEDKSFNSASTEEDNGYSFDLSGALTKGVEYECVFMVRLSDGTTCYYNCRVMLQSSELILTMVDFVRNFHDATLSKDGFSSKSSYLKRTDTSGELSHVTIGSTSAAVTWGNLSPNVISELYLTVLDINDSIGTFRFDYNITADDEFGHSFTAAVSETSCVQYTNGLWYYLKYDRQMTEIFEPQTACDSDGNLILGLQSADDAILKSSNGNYIAFTCDNTLWLLDKKGKSITRISGTGELGYPVSGDDAGYEILNVSDTGDVSFALKGYMKTGLHAGETGLELAIWRNSAAQLQEKAFIDTTESASVICCDGETSGFLSNNNSLFYICWRNQVSAIDLDSNEAKVIVADAEDSGLKMDMTNGLIGWQEGESIHILSLDTGEDRQIFSTEGESVSILGFTGKAAVIGYAKASDWNGDQKTSSSKLYYAIALVDNDGNEVVRYEKDGYRITGIKNNGDALVIQRVTLNSAGTVTEADDDALIYSGTQTVKTVDTFDSTKLEIRKTVRTIANAGTSLTFKKADKASAGWTMSSDAYLLGKYTAYSYKGIVMITDDLQAAIDAVYDDIGWVKDNEGNYLMRRGYHKSDATINVGDSQAMANAIARDVEAGTACDLSGISFDKYGYYFLTTGTPIYACNSDGDAVLMLGFVSGYIKIYDCATGKNQNRSTEYLLSTFPQVYVSFNH